MFPSSSFATKPSSRSTSIIGGVGSSGNSGLLASTVSNKLVANDEYENMMKKLSHEIESTSQNICELQIRRQQLLEQLDDVKRAYHKVLEQRSEWRLAVSFGSEGNEIGQLCRPWGVAIVRMPPSLLAHYLNDSTKNSIPANGFHTSSNSANNCTGLLSCSSNSCNSHNSNLNSYANNMKDNVTVGSSRPGLSSNTNATNTGTSSSIHPFIQENTTSASGSSSSSSSWELDFSLLAQYYLKLNDDALFQPFDPFTSPNDTDINSCPSLSAANVNIIDDKSTGISSSTTGNSVTSAATITGISSSHQASHSARGNYGSESVNINNPILSVYGSKQQAQQQQYFSTSLSSSSSYHNCDSSPSSSSSTQNSISNNLKNTITGNLSSYATTLQDNLTNANGSSSPSSHWDTNPSINTGFHPNNSNSNHHIATIDNLSNTYSSPNSTALQTNGTNRNVYKAANHLNGNNHTANNVAVNSSNSNNNSSNVNSDHRHYLIAVADRSNNRIQLLHFDATAVTGNSLTWIFLMAQ